MIWILIGYLWLYLHRPFEVWPAIGDLRVERVYVAIAVLCWLVIGKQVWTLQRNYVAVIGVAISVVIATAMSSYTDLFTSVTTSNWLKMAMFCVLLVTLVSKERDLKMVVSGFTICFFIYMAHSFREYYNGRGVYRMATWRMIGIDESFNDPNAFGASIIYALPLLWPLVTLLKKFWHYLFLIVYFLLSVRCIQLTGSRSAFMAIGVLLFIAAMLSRHRFSMLVLLALASPVVWFSLPEQLQQRYLTIVDPTIDESATASAEGRSQGFWDGVRNWNKSPIWGVGPGCHGLATGEGYQAHHLYGQIISELGSIGAVAYAFLVICYFLTHWEAHQFYNILNDAGRGNEAIYCYRVSLAVVVTVLMLMFLGFGGHNALRYSWVWYAAFQGIAVTILAAKADLLVRSRRRGIAPRDVNFDEINGTVPNK
ncbi:MAG: O-antigen ligase family protein [Thermoguttaceae bacterium]